MKQKTLLLAAIGVAFLTHILPASADAIDGNWCRADGKRMSISGPAIVTPGGSKTQGNYSRHAFDYVIPAGEQGAGNNVAITLLGETSRMRARAPTARCRNGNAASRGSVEPTDRAQKKRRAVGPPFCI